MYDLPVEFTPKFEKVDSVSPLVKGHEMMDVSRTTGLQLDLELWMGVTHMLAESAGEELNMLGDDLEHFWFEEDEDATEEEIEAMEWHGHDRTESERRLLGGSTTASSTLWVFMWLALDGFMDLAQKNHLPRLQGAKTFEGLTHKLESAVAGGDRETSLKLLRQILPVAKLSYLGTFQKTLGNLSSLWYLMCHQHRSKHRNQEYETVPRRRYQIKAGAGYVGAANMNSSQQFDHERGGVLVEEFMGADREYKEQLHEIFPCPHDELMEWFHRGFDEYGPIFGDTGASDSSEQLMDLAYGQSLRFKIASSLEKGFSSDVAHFRRAAHDVAAMTEIARPSFRAYAACMLRTLRVLYSDEGRSLLRGTTRVPKAKLLLVENLYQLKRVVTR